MVYQYKREPLNNNEWDNLVNSCNDLKEKLVIYTLLDTGMRVGEFANIKKDDIQWQEKRIIIHGKGGPYGKKSKRRVIPLTDRVKTLFEMHFTNHKDIGISVRTIQRMVKKVANKAGITKKVSPHVLRHTFAIMCIKRGISTRALMSLMGHDHLSTTEIYLNMSPEDIIKEFEEKW